MYLIKQMSVFSGSTQPMPGFLLAGHTSPVEPGFLPGMDKCKQEKMEGPYCQQFPYDGDCGHLSVGIASFLRAD